jgi:hypothetical protein
MTQAASPHPDFFLPLTIEEITPEWLTAAIGQRFPGVQVTASDVVDVNHGTCTKVRLRLAMNAAGQAAGIPETVILKGGFEPHSRDMYLTHEKEVRAYRDLFSELKLHSPACYFAGLDGARRQGIVIIEDLVARGVRFCRPQQPETPDAVARRLAALAAFHARSWDSPELRSGGRWSWAHDMLLESLSYMDRYLEPEIWDYYVRQPRGAAVAVQFQDRDWMAAALKALPVVARDLPRCLVHGDTHLGNLYVDPDGTPGFFDPQPMQAPALLEVTYHIAGALDPADRPRCERELVAHYLDKLRGHGIAAPDLDSAMQQYAAFLTLGYCIFLINAADFQPEAINTAYTARFSAAMLDHDSYALIRRVQASR